METLPDISVIIPTLNASRYIKKLLEALYHQEVKNLEIILIDSSSEDDTLKIAEAFGVKPIVIQRKAFDHGKTRNLAVKHSRGEIILFLTQDARPADNHYIKNLITPLADKKIAAAYGRQKPSEIAKPPERFARLFNYPEKPFIKGADDKTTLGIKTFFFSNVCSAIKRKEFEEVGCFLQKAIVNEDMFFAAALIDHGYKIAYVPTAVVIHSHYYSFVQHFKRYFDIGVFMKQNHGLFKDIQPEGEGMKFVIGEINYLWKEGAYHYIPYAFGESFFKYLGFKFGYRYDKLPMKLIRTFTMHGHYWHG